MPICFDYVMHTKRMGCPCHSWTILALRSSSSRPSTSTLSSMSTTHRPISLLSLAAGALLASGAHAHDNGMDMSMDGAMSLASGSMIPYLHFTSGDILWFYGWVPTSKGAMAGTCIGLFLLALVDRWIAAARSVMEVHWSKRYVLVYAGIFMAPPP